MSTVRLTGSPFTSLYLRMTDMVFALNTGEERIIRDIDYNAFFALRHYNRKNKKLRKAFSTWEKGNQSSHAIRLFNTLCKNAVRLFELKPLEDQEWILEVRYRERSPS